MPPNRLSALAADLGADVPFFLTSGTQLGRGDGTRLEPVDLPTNYHVVLLLPHGAVKESTAAVYDAFDRGGGAEGFETRRQQLLEALPDLAGLPSNDLASSPLAAELKRRGAFRADVSGAGPALYGLFADETAALAAAADVRKLGDAWVCRPCRGTVEPR
jgi:4-diphosphocytidyl-2-C-methyl-D-erythritol kinase